MLPKFVKVFPHEYKRVLGIPRQRARPQPLPPRRRRKALTLQQEVAHG